MARTIFVTGGARSGKSVFSEQKAEEFGDRLGYVATAQSLDGEMADRIERHRTRRGPQWHTIEEPLLLSRSLEEADGTYEAILVDCVTLWLTNLLFAFEHDGPAVERRIRGEVEQLAQTLQRMVTPVILVSNEVGMGIVPEHHLARLFRDIAGSANQSLAAAADEVFMVISGIPLKIK